jgi:hypothetical protein
LSGTPSDRARKTSSTSWQTSFDEMNAEWTSAGGATPTSPTRHYQKFLNEDAVKSLRKDDEDPQFVELILDLS